MAWGGGAGWLGGVQRQAGQGAELRTHGAAARTGLRGRVVLEAVQLRRPPAGLGGTHSAVCCDGRSLWAQSGGRSGERGRGARVRGAAFSTGRESKEFLLPSVLAVAKHPRAPHALRLEVAFHRPAPGVLQQSRLVPGLVLVAARVPMPIHILRPVVGAVGRVVRLAEVVGLRVLTCVRGLRGQGPAEVFARV